MDVKILSHVTDLLDQSGDFAVQLGLGNINSMWTLKEYLYESYLQLGGGVIDHEGNMIEKNAAKDLEMLFSELTTWEGENLKANVEKNEIDNSQFMKLKSVLNMIRSILYAERNRLFVKFITMWSETEKADRYAYGRDSKG